MLFPSFFLRKASPRRGHQGCPLQGEVAKLWTPSLGWGGAEPCSSWVSATAGAGGCWRGRVSPKSHGDPVSISKGKGDPRLRHRFCWVPLTSLWGMSGGGHFAWVREDFCFSCQVEEIWMEQWLPLSRHRFRASSLGWPCCWGRRKRGSKQGWWASAWWASRRPGRSCQDFSFRMGFRTSKGRLTPLCTAECPADASQWCSPLLFLLSAQVLGLAGESYLLTGFW